MTLEEELDKCVNKYLTSLLEKRPNKLLEKSAGSMGALKKFEFSNLVLWIINDRGIISIEINSKHFKAKHNMFDVSAYAESIGIDLRHEKQGIMCLSLEQQRIILEENWERLEDDMSKDKIQGTMKRIDDVRRIRSKAMFERKI